MEFGVRFFSRSVFVLGFVLTMMLCLSFGAADGGSTTLTVTDRTVPVAIATAALPADGEAIDAIMLSEDPCGEDVLTLPAGLAPLIRIVAASVPVGKVPSLFSRYDPPAPRPPDA